jgi:biopolymer transport protein ExbD
MSKTTYKILYGKCSSLLLVMLLSVFALCGCTSSTIEPGDSVKISVTSEGSIQAYGKKLPLSEVPARLESLGATPNTLVIIVGRNKAPLETMKKLYGELVESGFPKVVLRKPYEAKVEN